MQQTDLANIGLSRSQKKFLYEQFLLGPVGFVLVAAPTQEDSCTTSLSLLKEVARLHPGNLIITVENPTRCDLESALKLETEPNTSYIDLFDGITFRRPDIVYVDSMPNKEIADKVLDSTHYFKLLISNFKASSVYEVITRLKAMGFSKLQLTEALDLVISQSLVRKLCDSCEKGFDPLEEEIPDLQRHIKKLGWTGEVNFSRGTGKDAQGNTCSACQGTGYNGRVAVFEIFRFSEELSELVNHGANRDDLESQAEENGFQLLWYSGLEKALEQQTTLEELINVLGYPKRLPKIVNEDSDD